MGSIATEPDMSRDARGSDDEDDFSKPWLFDLNSRKPDKTIDIGGHGLSLSLDALGRVWISLALRASMLILTRCYKRAHTTRSVVS